MESRRRYIIAGAEEKERENTLSEEDSKGSVSSEKISEGNTKTFTSVTSGVRPWRTTQDFPRACLDVVIAGVGYLLYVCVWPTFPLSLLIVIQDASRYDLQCGILYVSTGRHVSRQSGCWPFLGGCPPLDKQNNDKVRLQASSGRTHNWS